MAMRLPSRASLLATLALLATLSSFCVSGLFAAATGASADDLTLAPGSRVWMHAHNCYPDEGAWRDRLTRALGTGLPWVATEQDLVWVPNGSGAGGQILVAHDTPARGDEPTLESHFFERVRPLLEESLARGDRERWPLIVLSLDFKTNEPEHHRAVWDLLGRYERYLTTTVKGSTAGSPSQLRVGPLLVLTESGPGQEDSFFTRHAGGTTLRLFGTVPPPDLDDDARKRRHEMHPETLIASGTTDYRRWVNLPWSAVEAGGPAEAGAWTDGDEARLRALVTRAHALGLWIRFYTLNGHPPDESLGWSDSYNFGSPAAVQARWQAVMRAGVDFVATDQYEAFADAWKRQQPAAPLRGREGFAWQPLGSLLQIGLQRDQTRNRFAPISLDDQPLVRQSGAPAALRSSRPTA